MAGVRNRIGAIYCFEIFPQFVEPCAKDAVGNNQIHPAAIEGTYNLGDFNKRAPAVTYIVNNHYLFPFTVSYIPYVCVCDLTLVIPVFRTDYKVILVPNFL